MALKIEITSADDILQFIKVLFVASEVIQKQFDDKSKLAVDYALSETANNDLIFDLVTELDESVQNLIKKTETIIKPKTRKAAPKTNSKATAKG